jgi:hypothetical protein
LNALTGRLDALNVFDGSRRGSFEDNYYRYLNIGLRLPIRARSTISYRKCY